MLSFRGVCVVFSDYMGCLPVERLMDLLVVLLVVSAGLYVQLWVRRG